MFVLDVVKAVMICAVVGLDDKPLGVQSCTTSPLILLNKTYCPPEPNATALLPVPRSIEGIGILRLRFIGRFKLVFSGSGKPRKPESAGSVLDSMDDSETACGAPVRSVQATVTFRASIGSSALTAAQVALKSTRQSNHVRV